MASQRESRRRLLARDGEYFRRKDRAYYAADPVRNLLRAARKRARQLGVEFGLERADVEIPGTCPVLGIDLRPGGGNGRMSDHSPTLDRICSWSGYIKGNVVVVSWRANRLKGDATLEEIQALARFYGKFRA